MITESYRIMKKYDCKKTKYDYTTIIPTINKSFRGEGGVTDYLILMNAKKTSIITLICIFAIGGLVLSLATTEATTPTTDEQCRDGSLDACNQIIKQQQAEYKELEEKMKGISQRADEARKVIQEQLSWTFM